MIRVQRWIGGMGVATLALALWVAPASAGPPGSWTQVTSEAQPSNTSEVGLERTADGALHVLWPRDSGATEEVVHTAIAADAKTVSDPHPLISTPNAVNRSVDLVAGPGGGIRALFAGIFPGAPTFSDGMATAVSGDGGSTWSAVAPASENDPVIAFDGTAYIGAGTGGGVATDGTVVSIWGDSSGSGAGFHFGLDPAAPDGALSPAVCERDPNVGVDSATGEVVLGWNCLATNSLQVLRAGAGAPEDAPSSGASELQQRIGLSGRLGADGVYAAYGSGTNPFDARPALWRVGAANAKVIKQPRDAEQTTLAPAPGGHLWIAWVGTDRGDRIFATRTNPAATKFGEVVSIKPPNGTTAVHRLAVEGSGGPLDVVALVERGPDDIAHWQQRVLPGLTLKAKPKQVKAGKKANFRVTDAGSGVGKAKVKLKLGKKTVSAKTKPNGKIKLKVPKQTKPRRYKATATKVGYAPGKARIRVR